MLPTPAATQSLASSPERSVDTPTPNGSIDKPAEPQLEPQRAPRRGNQAPRAQEVSGDFSEENIIESRTRRKRQAYMTALQEPERLDAYLSAFASGLRRPHRDQLPPPPRSWKELLKHPQHKGFRAAAEKEYRDLERRHTFRVVLRAADIKLLPLMWVFTYKFDEDGYLTKYKARHCVRGDLQDPTHSDTYAATSAARIFRTLMAIMAAFGLEARQYDAVNAFTNSPLDEDVHCACPEGYAAEGRCLRLLRALYGLRRSPLLWLKEFSTTLRELGLQEVPGEPCLFTNDWLILFFYVDDIVALCRKEHLPQLDAFERDLKVRYEISTLGELNWFLDIRVIRDRDARKVWLCQDSYIDKITTRFHLEHHKPALTPLPPIDLLPYEGKATNQEIHAYQQC
jgi:hypothetical protein